MYSLRFIKINPLVCLVILTILVVPLVGCASQNKAQSKLEEAREDLRVSQEGKQHATKELEQLKKSGKATPETLKEYETYLDRVQSLVDEKEKVVEEMEAAYSRRQEPVKNQEVFSPVQSESASASRLPEGKEPDEAGALDRELDDSLSEFDEMLLKEMDEIQGRSAERIRELSEEAEAAGKRLGDKGEGESSSEEETGSEEQAKETSSEGEREEGMNDEKATARERMGDREKSGKDATSGKQPEPKRDSDQDDIVARQLREAAEQETDPELKKSSGRSIKIIKRDADNTLHTFPPLLFTHFG